MARRAYDHPLDYERFEGIIPEGQYGANVRATSLPGPSRRDTVPAHLFAYQIADGVIHRAGFSAIDAVLNLPGCTNPNHLRLGAHATTSAEYLACRSSLVGPLADVRGPAGRTRAVAAAIRIGLKNYEDPMRIERRIESPNKPDVRLTLW